MPEASPRQDTGPRLPVAPQETPLGVYLHIPFCASICNYCNFNRGLADEALQVRYVEALEREIRFYADGSAVDTIYFGGGTPSLLRPPEVAALVVACRSAFAVADDVEITVEANPETLTEGYLAALRQTGVNRLSIGVQSFHDEELRRLDRRHTADRARRAMSAARGAGFDNVSFDLMMWLPEQSLSAWLANVESLIDLAPEHASLYLLEIYPNAPLREAIARHQWAQASDDLAADMYVEGLERLEAFGYRQYEISNVALGGRFSRHNLKYWTDGTWLGLGAGAHGTRCGSRWRNVASTGDYIDRVTAGDRPIAETRPLSADDAVREALFMGMRLSGGIDVRMFDRRHRCDIMSRFGEALVPFVAEGLVVASPDAWRLTRRGMLLGNEVLAVFV